MVIYKTETLKNKHNLIVKLNHVCLCVECQVKER